MRRVGCVAAIAAAVLTGTGCDTSQPTEGGNSVAEVQIEAIATVEKFDCYDRFNAGTFDRIQCFPAIGASQVQARVPWNYSFRVIVLRSGQTFPEVVAGSINNDGTFPTFGDTTRFDVTSEPAPIRNDEPPYSYQNPRRVTAGHLDFFAGYIQQADGSIRPPLPIPTPNILGITSSSPGVSPRYASELHPGDSLIIEAAEQKVVNGPPIFPANVVPKVFITAKLFVGGAETTPRAGTVESSPEGDGAGLSFNYVVAK
jgi:hypothetical protein